MKVLITGVAGFLGSHIAEDLLKRGHSVVGIDNLVTGETDNIPEGVDFLQMDLADTYGIREKFEGVDVVVHTACTAYEGLSVFSPAFVSQNTYQITASTLSAAARAGVKKFIHMSSMARYGTQEALPYTEDMTPKPQDPYGIAKLASEELVKNICDTHNIDWKIIVPHNIIGPRQKYDDPYRNVASIMMNRMLQNKQPIIYGNGTQMRCFSYVDDVVDPIRLLIESDAGSKEIINVGPDDKFITINELAKEIASILNFQLDPIYLPDRPKEVKLANCSANKARELLNYEAKTSLEDALFEMSLYIKRKGPKPFKYHLPVEIVDDSTPRSWTDKLF